MKAESNPSVEFGTFNRKNCIFLIFFCAIPVCLYFLLVGWASFVMTKPKTISPVQVKLPRKDISRKLLNFRRYLRNKIEDEDGNSYKIMGIYRRQFSSFTYTNKSKFVFLEFETLRIIWTLWKVKII